MIPARIGRYEILAELGRGAMGTVYRARDPIVGREVAIKTLEIGSFPKRQQQEILARFRREAQAAGQLNHPNIVTVFDVGENFFVMELVRGETLQARVARRGRFSLEEVLAVIAPIATALDYAHARGVVHRDVKPANIMVTDRGIPKLMDFGLAHRDTTVLTRAGQSLGSPAYMAPEQIQSLAPTPRADLYSLAVVTYEMLTGGRPFTGKNVTTLLYQVVHESPVPPRRFNASLPTRYDELFERALSKAPEERFPDAASFVTELNLRELEAIVSLIGAPEPPPCHLEFPADEIQEQETMKVAAAPRPSASATERRSITRPIWKNRSRVAAPAALLAAAAAAILAPWLLAPGIAPLDIGSSPSGAVVWLDGVEVGTTPLVLEEVSSGEHEIRVVKEGFVTVRERVSAGPGTAPLVYALQPARVSLSVASTPSPASVLVDGEEVGQTPLEEVLLDEGRHRLEVRHQGFQPFGVELDAQPGESLHYTARLQPIVSRKKTAAVEPKAPPPLPPPTPVIAELGDADVVPPHRVSGEFARYPDVARRKRASGTVIVSMIISDAGVPEGLQVLQSGGPLLDEAVLEAIQQWRFQPATRGGRPVPIRWRVRQHFRLEP